MHEWAMAYKSVQNNIRHDYLDLRLGAEGTTGWLSRTASAVRISMRSGFHASGGAHERAAAHP